MYLLSSAGFALIASGMILLETSQIIHGGQRNYIMATVLLYVSIYNLFTSLLQLLMVFARKRDDWSEGIKCKECIYTEKFKVQDGWF